MNLTKKLDRSQCMDYIQRNEATVKMLYITKNLTAKVVAEKLNIHHGPVWAKALLDHFGAKGMGKGGARQGSGNKRGIKFCPTCNKKLTPGHECELETGNK